MDTSDQQTDHLPHADGGETVEKEEYDIDDAAHHHWHTCSECGRNWYVAGEGNHCPACGSKPACAAGGECLRRYALVDVIAPDGSREDSVKVQFEHEQPIGIDPLSHEKEGRFPDDYHLKLRYIVIDNEQFLPNESRQVGG